MRAKRKEKFESANLTSTKTRHVKQKFITEPLSAKSTYVVPVVPPKTTTSVVARSSTYKTESKTDIPKERPTIYCFNCRGAGHIARDCPKPRRPIKCSNCGSDQHTRGRCSENVVERSETASVADQAFRADATASAKSGNPFVKTVRVNGRPVNGLIDTGSSAVLMRISAARECDVAIRDTVCPLYTVGDATQPSATTIGEGDAEVSIDGVSAADHTIKIVPDSSIPVDVLVGRTWLDLPHVNYFKQGGEIVFDSINRVQTDVLDVSRADDNVYVSVTESVRPTKVPITENDVVIDSHVSADQRETLVALLNEYRDAFAKNITELGCTDVIAMDISETPGSVPVSLKPYRTSPSDRRIISSTLQEWREAGIISDSISPYASPVLLVNKSSGEKRLCVDYRRLNQQTVNQPYPMPDVDSQLGVLSHGVIFTTLDLSNGFLQIPLTPEAKDKTAFVTEEATAKFERMPFGLKGAPGTFQKLMSIVFKDLKSDGVVSTYLDDIILPSKSWDHMMLDLRRVLSALRAANLTLKPSKCTFGAHELDYLGFRISEGTVKPGRKVRAIAKFPRPRDTHEVRRFLGLAGYFRRFIIKYAQIAAPLTCLTGKDVPFVWPESQDNAFTALREILCNEPVVRMYNPEAAVTQVHTDASSLALSGILLQGEAPTTLHMVYAVSKKTTSAESKYHSSRLELLAIIGR